MSDFDNLADFEHLDGQEYHPAPYVVEDTRQGYDQEGNWHAFMSHVRGDHDPNGAAMDTPHTLNLPYRLATQMQEAIVHQVEQNDYYVGQVEREDMATNIAHEWYNNRTFEPPEIALDALVYWRRMYLGRSDGWQT